MLHSLGSSILNPYITNHNHKKSFFSKSKPTKTIKAQKNTEIIDKKSTSTSPMNMEIRLQEKPVQEIVIEKCKNGEIPEEFIHLNGYPQAKAETLPYMDDFTVDFSLLTSSSSSPEAERELQKFYSAVTQWGCFQGVNHGMSNEFIDKVYEAGRKFFALPLEEKQKYSREIKAWEGYGNDNIFNEGQTLDWLDRLYLTVHPEDRRKLKYWPENPPEFRETLHEYTMKLRELFDHLLKAMAHSLNIEDDAFLKEHGDIVTMFARYNFYPPCPNPESVLGLKPHADGVTITMLLQDKEVEGLQVLKDDQWYRIPTVPHALFVNVGDILAVMSNGLIKSPVHRVVTNSERERMTLVMFCYAELDREMGPLPELITPERPQMYKRVKHYEKLLVESYVAGKRPLHALSLFPTE